MKPLSDDFQSKIRGLLAKRRNALKGLLRAHEDETTQAMPSDKEEAVSARERMDVLETGEKAEAETLDRIEEALVRLDQGRLNVCESCRGPISEERLLAIPWASRCVGCAGKAEKKRGT